MTDPRHHQLLQLGPSHEAAPVLDHSLLVNLNNIQSRQPGSALHQRLHLTVQLLSVRPLVYNLVLEIPEIDLFEEDWSYPRLEQEPPTKVDSPG